MYSYKFQSANERERTARLNQLASFANREREIERDGVDLVCLLSWCGLVARLSKRCDAVRREFIQIRAGNSICIDQIIPFQIVRKIFISMGNCL